MIIYGRSTTHRRIINDKADYISGKGFTCDEAQQPQLAAFVRCVNGRGESLRQVLGKLAFDKSLFGNAFLEAVTDPGHTFLSLYHQDASRCRVARDSKHILLHQTDARIAAVYASRSGRPAAEFEALMAENNGNGRWLAPEEAVAAGLADKVVEAAEQPASSLARNIARGWERLLANIGLRPGPALPADRNVLHFDGEVQALRSRSAVAADEARRQAAPTSTQPREDPSCGDTVRSANERAYAEDARRMRN